MAVDPVPGQRATDAPTASASDGLIVSDKTATASSTAKKERPRLRSILPGILRDAAEDLIFKSMIIFRVVIDSAFLVAWVALRAFVHRLLESAPTIFDRFGGWELEGFELIFDAAVFAAVLLVVIRDIVTIIDRVWRKT